MSEAESAELVARFAKAPTLEALPDLIDIRLEVPPNPPEDIQVKFAGLSYENAYAEAASFVEAADQFAAKHGSGGFQTLDRIIDFGSGWGRITRMLLARVGPTHIHALDVDPQMTALINTTLPGVNALTVSYAPPTILGDGSVDAAVAFSVFSHLSGPAHEAWAAELGRLVDLGGVVAITVLDQAFFDQVAGAKAAVQSGTADGFSASLADCFDDVQVARAGYKAGEIQYAGTGGGEIRTGDYYGWAAAPAGYIERVWGAAGFRLVEWVPSGVLFQQALVLLVKEQDGGAQGASDSLRAVANRGKLGWPFAAGKLASALGRHVLRRARRIAGRVKARVASRP